MPVRGGGRTPNGKYHLKVPFWLLAHLPKSLDRARSADIATIKRNARWLYIIWFKWLLQCTIDTENKWSGSFHFIIYIWACHVVWRWKLEYFCVSDNNFISLSRLTKKSRLPSLVIIYKYSSTGEVPLSWINMVVVLRLEELGGVGGLSALEEDSSPQTDLCLVMSTRKIHFTSYTDLIATEL